jgi:hypothetical protein
MAFGVVLAMAFGVIVLPRTSRGGAVDRQLGLLQGTLDMLILKAICLGLCTVTVAQENKQHGLQA